MNKIRSRMNTEWRLFRSVAAGLALLVSCDFRLAADESVPQRTVESQAQTENSPDVFSSWGDNLQDAVQHARTTRTPIVVVAGATWCLPCRALEQELVDPDVQAALANCNRVHIDVDRDPEAARVLAVASIPAVRILSPDGRLIAAREGVVPAAELAVWINETVTVALDDAELSSVASVPTLITVRRVLEDFSSRESTVREAAVSYLARRPDLAAGPVLEKLGDGNLSERLAALELLQLWGAPVASIDPWIPATCSLESLSEIDAWISDSDFTEFAVGPLSDTQTIDATRMLRDLLSADPVAAAAIREQLARMGSGILPLIRQAAAESDSDIARSRLTAVRYRLAATDQLMTSWPEGIEQLASTDFTQRVDAAGELSKRATAADADLLLELFSDPAPLIREIGIEALHRVSGSQTSGALVRLLDDPDANVRAAVLKKLAEQPTPELAVRIAAYSAREQDADLVVHTIRFLREVQEPVAIIALMKLLEHQDWRVRADAAEGINHLIGESDLRGRVDQNALGAAYLKLLDDTDEFVVGRAMDGIAHFNSVDAWSRISELAGGETDLAPMATRKIGEYFGHLKTAGNRLVELCSHSTSEVRAAAIEALLDVAEDEAQKMMPQMLNDESVLVRIAAVNALFADYDSKVRQRIRTALASRAETAMPESPRFRNSTDIDMFPANRDSDSSFLSVIRGLLFGVSGDEVDAPAVRSVEPDRAVAEVMAAEVPDAAVAAETHLPPDDAGINEATTSHWLDALLVEQRASDSVRQWMEPIEPDLAGMLQHDDAAARYAAARLLAAYGHASGMPALIAAATDARSHASLAAVFAVLTFEEKTQLFDALRPPADDMVRLTLLSDAVGTVDDSRTSQLIWQLLDDPAASAVTAKAVRSGLVESYFSQSVYSAWAETDSPETVNLIADCRRRALSGSRWARTTALAVLGQYDRAAAAVTATEILSDESLPDDFRRDTCCAKLFFSEDQAAKEDATAVLLESHSAFGDLALRYVTLGRDGVAALSGGFLLQAGYRDDVSFSMHSHSATPSPIQPALPEGIGVEHVTPYLDCDDPLASACAAAALAILGDAQHLDTVVRYAETDRSPAVSRMLYRAIAAVDSNTHVPLLKQLYEGMRDEPWSGDIAEFYWTIRIMTGSDVLALRKQIRDEQGASALTPSFEFGLP